MFSKLLTSSFLVLTVSVFMLISTAAVAKTKDQGCPSGENLQGYDIYGNSICVIDSTLNSSDFVCPCFDKATVQSLIQGFRGWLAPAEGQCFREEGAVKYVGCAPLGPNASCPRGIIAAGLHSLIGNFSGPSTEGVQECIIIDEPKLLHPGFGSDTFRNKFGQALMPHTAQACMDIILEVMEEEGCPREDDCGNGIIDPGEACDWNGDDDCNRECLVQ
jgi:hypothetical protein